MSELDETGQLLDGILAVAHPELFKHAGRLKATMVKNNPSWASIISQWPTHYLAAHLIVNRESLFHRDPKATPGWLDMLASLGTEGDESSILSLRTLGVSIPYGTGTIALINGAVVVHGVPPVIGDRICYAWGMNRHIFEYYSIYFPDWAFVPIRG